MLDVKNLVTGRVQEEKNITFRSEGFRYFLNIEYLNIKVFPIIQI
jgi:hypothetical protein